MCDNKSIQAAQEDLGASTDVVSTDDEATPSIAGDSPDEDADEILFVDIIPAEEAVVPSDESANGNEVAQNAPTADEQSVEASKVDPTPEENDKEAKIDEDNEIPFHE